MSDGNWDAATWKGARRAQLRRSLRLSVRERLEIMEALSETAARLSELSAEARERRQGEAESSGSGDGDE